MNYSNEAAANASKNYWLNLNKEDDTTSTDVLYPESFHDYDTYEDRIVPSAVNAPPESPRLSFEHAPSRNDSSHNRYSDLIDDN